MARSPLLPQYKGGRGAPAQTLLNQLRRMFSLQGRPGHITIFSLGTLLTVIGVLCMILSLIFDPTVFLHLTYAYTEPLQVISHNTHLFTTTMSTSKTITKPSKKEVGNAGWLLIHTIAANYPHHPSENEKYHAKAFLRSIAKLYPCKKCRYHFDRYLTSTPPQLSNRDEFVLWACGAHNAVNRRNGKPEFPCRMKNLDQRWGDCGCRAKK